MQYRHTHTHTHTHTTHPTHTHIHTPPTHPPPTPYAHTHTRTHTHTQHLPSTPPHNTHTHKRACSLISHTETMATHHKIIDGETEATGAPKELPRPVADFVR